jgi:hypothetical protein
MKKLFGVCFIFLFVSIISVYSQTYRCDRFTAGPDANYSDITNMVRNVVLRTTGFNNDELEIVINYKDGNQEFIYLTGKSSTFSNNTYNYTVYSSNNERVSGYVATVDTIGDVKVIFIKKGNIHPTMKITTGDISISMELSRLR